MDLRGVLQVWLPSTLWPSCINFFLYLSELAEPHKLLSYLLQPKVLSLFSDIIALYLQSALKVFGSWSTELADQWDDENLPKVKGVVTSVLERLGDFASNPDIEVQERVRRHYHSIALQLHGCGPFLPFPSFVIPIHDRSMIYTVCQ